jgi:hypothetical protein
MVLSAPRSASTWAANWLTTEHSLCLHDPVFEHRPELLDQIHVGRMLGISCTALGLLPAFVNTHPARKVIVHRDLDDVNRSLVTLGLTPLGSLWRGALERLEGMHVQYEDLFNAVTARPIYEHLVQRNFDEHRHAQLCEMHVEPCFDKVRIDPVRVRDFRKRLIEACA